LAFEIKPGNNKERLTAMQYEEVVVVAEAELSMIFKNIKLLFIVIGEDAVEPSTERNATMGYPSVYPAAVEFPLVRVSAAAVESVEKITKMS
jgi:hypothetical protein